MRYFFSVNYEDGDQSTYKGIDIYPAGGPMEIIVQFDSGNYTVDYIDYLKWIPENAHIGYSSSWDHFFMDGNIYKSIHIDHHNDEEVITGEWSEEMRRSTEYPVPVSANIKSFEDLKEYYRQEKAKNEVQ